MQNEAKRLGFRLDHQTGVYVLEEKADFAYADRDGLEAEVLQILRDCHDKSVLSEELVRACRDWGTTYHLSSLRANLLRPFETELLGSSVLEVGAGCGAITRYLGETCSEVVAVEGSFFRASIAAERTRDLENVKIFSCAISNFDISEKFDFIVVVGVLEYAALFEDSNNPHEHFIRTVAKHLKPTGKLLLAIENKVGLKYLGGAPEDHTNEVYVGVENRYFEKGVRTFTKRGLEQLLHRSGFTSTYFHLPVPDYKLVRSLITQSGAVSTKFYPGEILRLGLKSDMQMPPETPFDVGAAWSVIEEAGITSDLANSFLVEASLSSQPSLLESSFAFHYGPPRKKAYSKETLFHSDPEGSVMASTRPLGETEPEFEDVAHLSRRTEEYRVVSESFRLGTIMEQHDWSPGDLASRLDNFVSNFLELGSGLSELGAQIGALPVPNNFFDLLPRNSGYDKEGRLFSFDLEWSKRGQLELGHWIWRILDDEVFNTSITKTDNLGCVKRTKGGLIEWVMESLGLDVAKIPDYLSFEYNFQRQVSPAVGSFDQFKADHFDSPLWPSSVEETTAARDAAISISLDEMNKALSDRDAALDEMNKALSDRDAALDEMNKALSDRDAALDEMNKALSDRDAAQLQIRNLHEALGELKGSLSWRLTAPARKLLSGLVR